MNKSFTEDLKGGGATSEIVARLLAMEKQQRSMIGGMGNVTVPSPSPKYMKDYDSDFIEQNGIVYGSPPWIWSDLAAGGAFSSIAGTPDHPGIIRASSAAINATGACIYLYASAFLIAGGEETTIIFSPQTANAQIESRFGFLDVFTNAAPTDGVWMNLLNTTITGKTRSNSAETSTGTTGTIAAGTWYRGEIKVNDDATLVNYYLYDCLTQALLWSDTVATNIPTAVGREVGHGAVSYRTNNIAAVLMYYDYLSLVCKRPLTR